MAALWKSVFYLVSTEVPAACTETLPLYCKSLNDACVLLFPWRQEKSESLCLHLCSHISLISCSHCASVLSLFAPFSLFPLAPPAPPLRPVELWACPKWMPPACRTSTSSLPSLVSTPPGQTLLMVIRLIIMIPFLAFTKMMMMMMMKMKITTLLLSREDLGLMSCDDISRYSLSSQSGSKGSETVSYYLDQDSGQFFSLLEGDGPPGPEYDRARNTGVRRRDKTPTHGKAARAVGGANGAVIAVSDL